MDELSSKIVESIDLAASAVLSNSGLPKTIDCEIIELKDAATGLYTVRYMENELEVYASSPTLQYNTGEKVSVLVPSGDLAKTKYIIGAAVPAGYMYSSLTSISDDESNGRLVKDGDIFNFGDIELCSFTPTYEEIEITDSFNIALLRKNIESGYRNFTFTFEIKTNLPQEQKRTGNYGLVFKIPVLIPSDSANVETNNFIESWVVASLTAVDALRGLQGRVYDFTEYTLQSKDFVFPENAIYDGTRYPKLIKIVENFIEREDRPNDIFFKNIYIKGLTYLPLNENNGNYLAISATEGEFFTENVTWSSIKTLVPVLKLHGKDKDVKGYDCYWYVEDCSIKNIDDEGYETHGGFGWHCLNEKEILETQEGGSDLYQWVTNIYSLNVKKEDVYNVLRYKCVLVQADFSISGEIELKNLQPLYETSLAVINGTALTPDYGKAWLAARIRRVDDTYSNNISLSTEWQRYDQNGNIIIELNDNIPEIGDINEKEVINDNIWLKSTVAYPCAIIDKTNMIRCSFIEKKVDDQGNITTKVIGTEKVSITIGEDFTYKINIINDRYVYNYDADGDSPMVADYDGPASSVVKQINPISFSIYDKEGNELSDEDYEFCKITWMIPKNSMIKLPNGTSESRSDDNYFYLDYNGKLGSDLYYEIYHKFDTKKAYNNTIILQIIFKGYDLKENINLSFVKDGMSGTNGTKFSAVIKYNGYAYGEVSKDILGRTIRNRFLPVYYLHGSYQGGSGTWCIYHPVINDTTFNRLNRWEPQGNDHTLEVEVYKDGEKIEYPSGVYSVSWSMLDPLSCDNCFTIDEETGKVDYTYWTPTSSSHPSGQNEFVDTIIVPTDPCNIVKCEITIESAATGVNRKQKIYAFYPIDFVVITVPDNGPYFDNGEVNLLDIIGGYEDVMYAADGTNPQYDNTNPFNCKANFSRTAINAGKYIDTDYQNTKWYTYDEDNFTSMRESVDKMECSTQPAQKYTNGKTKNLLGFSGKIKHDEYSGEFVLNEETGYYNWVEEKIVEGIETDIEKVEEEITNLQEEYNIDSVFLANLDIFQHQLDNGEIFSYNNYIEKLENSKDMLNPRSLLFSYITEILKILDSIKKYTIDSSRPVTFTPDLNNSISFIEEMKNNLLHFGDPDSLLKTDYDDIKDYFVIENVYNMSFSADFVKTEYGLSIYNKLKNYVDSLNELLSIYFSKIDLMKTATTDLVEFDQLRSSLNAYLISNSALDVLTSNDNMGEEFKSYKNIISSMFNSLSSTCIGYDQIYKMLQNFRFEQVKYTQNYYTEKYQRIKDSVKFLLDQKEAELIDLNGIALYNCFTYFKSIHSYLNYYSMSNLNEWDGTKIYFDNDEQYILAPQIGAGYKNSDNTYTGLVMGITNINNGKQVSDDYQKCGLLGLANGEQSLFISAETGSAVFGKTNGGKIIVDPSQSKALIYSDNYWRRSNEDGLPSDYNASNMTYKGMMINLSDSYIHLGENKIDSLYPIDSLEDAESIINAYFERNNSDVGFYEADANFKEVFEYGDWDFAQHIYDESIPTAVMPEPSVDEIDNIYRYIGNTTEDFTYGCYYHCVRHSVIPEKTHRAPNGILYSYKVLPKDGAYWYITTYTDRKVCFSKETYKESGEENYRLLGLGYDTYGSKHLVDITCAQSTTVGYVGNVYPSSGYVEQYDDAYQCYSGNNPPDGYGSWYCAASKNPDIPIFDTILEAYEYVISEDYTYEWEQIDVQDKGSIWIAANPEGIFTFFSIGEFYKPDTDPNHTYISKTSNGGSTNFTFNGSNSYNTIYKQYAAKWENGAWVECTSGGMVRRPSLDPVSYNYSFDVNWLVNERVPSIVYNVTKYGRLYSGHHTTLNSTQPGFYLDATGLSIGSKFKAKLTQDGGTLLLGDGAVTETGRHWTVDSNSTGNSFIAYGTTTYAGTGNDQVYVGTDGIRLGNNFKVDSGGNLTSVTGNIGGWSIGSNYLMASGITLDATGRIVANNGKWEIKSNGQAIFQDITANVSGTIGGWTINGNVLIGGTGATALTLNGNTGSITGPGFTLNSSGLNLTSGRLNLWNGTTAGLTWNGTSLIVKGEINATSGTFGDWTIGGSGLTSGIYYSGETISGTTVQITPSTVCSLRGIFKEIICAVSAASDGSISAGTARLNRLLLWRDGQSGGAYKPIETIIEEEYYTKDQIDSMLGNYVTRDSYNSHVHRFSGSSSITTSGSVVGVSAHTHTYSATTGSGNTGEAGGHGHAFNGDTVGFTVAGTTTTPQ